MIEKLQFISNETAGLTHLESIQIALEAGCRWIQLRIKDQSEKEVLKTAYAAKELCDTYGGKLIINDFPDIAKAVGAYGLHLGLTDMPIKTAREIVGADMIIGGTANTFENILSRVDEGADYVGIGPFRYTTTKKNLSPVLGLEGFRNLTASLGNLKLSIPLIAIGGITPDDIADILATRIYGVAISNAILSAEDPKKIIHTINEILCLK